MFSERHKVLAARTVRFRPADFFKGNYTKKIKTLSCSCFLSPARARNRSVRFVFEGSGPSVDCREQPSCGRDPDTK